MMRHAALAACLFMGAGMAVDALEVFTRKPRPDVVATEAELKELAPDIVYWRKPQDRTLTYWINRGSFRSPVEADLVETFLRAAAKDWSDACPECGVVFEPSVDETRATFKVQRSSHRVLTQSFYPDYQLKWRIVIVGDLFFSSADEYDQVGMLRHELGHILGYRHEHLRLSKDVQLKCKWGPDPQSRLPLPLTPYDSDSVMHYPCGTPLRKAYFRLSPLDVEGHRKLYRP